MTGFAEAEPRVAGAARISGELRRAEPFGTSLLDSPPRRAKGESVVAGAGAALLHAGFVALAIFAGTRLAHQAPPSAAVTEMIEVELPTPELSPRPEEPAPSVPAAPARHEPARSVERPTPLPALTPPAAQAGQVLTASDEVVDFGETYVTGKGASYAGGASDRQGTAEQAARSTAVHTAEAEPIAKAKPLPDRSRAPQLAGGMRWACPFPREADELSIDRAVVTLQVEVGARGEVLGVHVTSASEEGFARQARRCAKSKRWSPGLDRDGQARRAAARVNVTFQR